MRKYIYPLLLLIVAAGYYWYETQENKQESANNLEREEIQSQNKDGIKSLSRKDFIPASDLQVIHHNTYSLAYDEKHEQASWTAHILRPTDIVKATYKRPYFEIDKKVSTGAAHWRNYKNSGYDRGHLVPAGDRRATQAAYDETFLTSNIAPQQHDFNAGIWNRLEQKVRYYAQRHGELYVITGSVLNDDLKTIGTENVSVPEYFYKIIYHPSIDGGKMLAFYMPHKASKKSLFNYLNTVDFIEKKVGVDFFSQLEDRAEKKLESTISKSGW